MNEPKMQIVIEKSDYETLLTLARKSEMDAKRIVEWTINNIIRMFSAHSKLPQVVEFVDFISRNKSQLVDSCVKDFKSNR